MSLAPDDLWSEILNGALERVKRTQFDTWLAKLRPAGLTGDILTLEAPNAFCQEWVRKKYLPMLCELAAAASGRPLSVDVRLGEPVPGDRVAAAPEPAGAMSRDRLNPSYTFDNFVVGPSNRLPHAASLAVSESPGKAYNPLFVHGGSGLGKTHLLHAICHRVLQRQQDASIRVLSCEEFVNAFIHAVEGSSLAAFRGRYRNVDVFVLDDIQFLAGKETTQEEMFHTFNTLFNAQRQIILASDRAPTEIPTLEERLISRFKWGLVARIEPPSFETRVGIVQKKAALRQLAVEDRVAQFIASRAELNVREIEGALAHLATYSAEATPEDQMAGLTSFFGDAAAPAPRLSVADIQEAVTKRFEVRLADLQSKKRHKSVSRPRQICIYLARQLTRHSLEEIGGFFGGRDHSTILYAEEKVRDLMLSDPGTRSLVEDLLRELQAKY